MTRASYTRKKSEEPLLCLVEAALSHLKETEEMSVFYLFIITPHKLNCIGTHKGMPCAMSPLAVFY